MDLAVWTVGALLIGGVLGYMLRSHIHTVIENTIALIHKTQPPAPPPPATG